MGIKKQPLLVITLATAAALRLWIVFSGGQQFWPDESRYAEARAAVARMASGQWRGAWQTLLGAADHVLFKIVGLIPAAGEALLGKSQHLPAAFFAAFSVLSIWMVGRVVRRAGGGDAAALWATVLAAGANCLFYYSRHFFPYDLSLFLGLCAWDCALNTAGGRNAWFRTGLWAGLCFLGYNGYWILGGGAMIAGGFLVCHEGPRAMARRWLWASLGLALPLGLVSGLAVVLGRNFPRELAQFSGTISQGDLGEAWLFIPEYFWEAEKWNAVLLAAMVLGAAVMIARKRRLPGGGVALSAFFGMWIVLVLLSDWAGRFVVYGREARILVPFACMAGGAVLAHLANGGRWSRWCAAAVTAAYLVQAAVNFRTPVSQWFPVEFQAQAARKAAVLKAASPGNYRVVNASFFFTPDAIPRMRLPGRTVWREEHPQQFKAYLFEGFTRAERAKFSARDCSMQLVSLGAEENRGWLGSDPALRRLAGYPGRMELRLRFRDRNVGSREPLVVTGESGRGDILYVIYQDSAHIRLGFDHWGEGGPLSEPLEIDFQQPHRLVIGLGSMYPPDFVEAKRRRLFASLDGRVVFDRPQEFYPSDAGAVIVGLNLIGGSSTLARFNGVIERVVPADP